MSRALVLMYHRVAEVGPDPWGLRVTPKHFAEQVAVLRRSWQPLGLRQLVSGLETESVLPRSVVVTLDDGYADNLEDALPVLRQSDVPATCFLVTGNLESGEPFWWDVLQRVFLHPGTLPSTLSLHLDGTEHQWQLGDAKHYSSDSARGHLGWRSGQPCPTARHSTYLSVWEHLRLLPDGPRRQAVHQVASWGGVPWTDLGDYRLLTPRQALDLAGSELIEAGAHSVTHPMLDALPAEGQEWEIEQSKSALQNLLGMPVTSFSYPHGAHTQLTVDLVRKSGLGCACTTRPGPVESGSDPYRLARMHVEDWDGAEFEARLSRWLGVDS